MLFFTKALLLSAFVLHTNFVRGEGTENNSDHSGINFCSDSYCQCYVDLKPVEFNCDGVGLKSLWEEADWKETFKALNLTGEEKLYVSLDNNELEHIPKFPPLNITILTLKNNKIRAIESSAFAALESLQTLDLSQNSLSKQSLFEGVFFGKYKSGMDGYFPMPLKHLNLSQNNIHSIPKYAFDHFAHLTSLDLGSNPMTTLAGSTQTAVGELLNLEFLGLSNASLSDIPEAMLHDLGNLKSLELSYNLFTSVPKEAGHAKSLQVLTLDGNLFETLDESSFVGMEALEDLSISRMDTLRRIDSFAFAPLKNLTKLVMAFNPGLSDIDDGAFEGLVTEVENWKLTEIHMNDNGLTRVDHALVPWEKVDYVDIQNNPFTCDCNLEWMALVLVKHLHQSQKLLTRNLICREPSDFSGKNILEISDNGVFAACDTTTTDKLRKSKESKSTSEIEDEYSAAGLTSLVAGILLIMTGMAILIFIAVKRNAIIRSLMPPPTTRIRYHGINTAEDIPEWKHNIINHTKD